MTVIMIKILEVMNYITSVKFFNLVLTLNLLAIEIFSPSKLIN